MCTPIHHYWTLNSLISNSCWKACVLLHYGIFFFLSLAKGLPASMRAEWGFSFKGKKKHFLFKTYHAFILPVASTSVKYWKLLSVPLSQLLKAVLFTWSTKNLTANGPQNVIFFWDGIRPPCEQVQPSVLHIRVWKKKKWLREPYRGAFASLTSHTLFFQMNLRLFLSKSPQK